VKIRKKLPKAPRAGVPLAVIGYSSAPEINELQTWFDREYGGPLTVKQAPGQESPEGSPLLLATHGPWQALVRLTLPESEAEAWKQRLDWSHSTCAGLWRSTAASRGQAIDATLHAARLARGLVLLTQGTAYDVPAHRYLNPSDCTDRRLAAFEVRDHVTVTQSEDTERGEWFSTRGLSKFGIDDIEIFRPVGLPANPVMDQLLTIAAELVRRGQSPNVGITLEIPELDRPIRVVRHRTVPSADTPLILREVAW
jgi:hypothetical protein